jgi:hypothetical protein
MVESTLESITEAEWASMIAENGTIMIQATLQGNATLTDINIYVWETNSWISQGPEAASGFNTLYVTNEGEQLELITTGYDYTGGSESVDSGSEQKLTIDSTIFSEMRKITVRDIYDNLLSEEQRDLNNWVRNTAAWNPSITYDDGVNIVDMLTVSGWESFVTQLDVTPDTDYELIFLFNSPTGYTAGPGNSRRAFVWNMDWIYSNADRSLTDSKLIAYSDVWGTEATENPTEYTVQFNSGENTKVKIELTFGSLTDDQRATMLFHSIKIRKV